MEAWVPGFITGMLALIGVISAALLQARRERQKDQRDSSTPGTPTVQDIWKRQDSMEGAFKASLVLLAEAVEQHNAPDTLVFNPIAVKTLRASGFMPPELENVLNSGTEQGE